MDVDVGTRVLVDPNVVTGVPAAVSVANPPGEVGVSDAGLRK